jgi:tRNA A37 threonylcarbamoyladenosine dehydratase
VVGLGGVGSHAANMLVRSGVTHIRLVDFDQVTLSSLNRHAMATLPDVGTPKVEAMRKYFEKLIPWCKVEAIPQMFKAESAAELLSGNPDYVLDCIDDVSTKAELIAYCVKNNIPVITSTGAGAKADPTKLRIGRLSDCIKDPLAAKIKWKLKKHDVAPDDITTVFSVEKPACNLVPLSEEQKAAPASFGAVDYFRLRIMPVLGTSPAIFGQSMAAFVACTLAGYQIEPDSQERMSRNMRHKMLQHLRTVETRRYETPNFVNIDDEELEFLIQQVWRNRCATTNLRIGGHAAMVLSRWDVTKPPTVSNLIMTTQKEATRLDELGQRGAFSEEMCAYITKRLLWAQSVYEDDEFGNVRIPSDSSVADTPASCALWSALPACCDLSAGVYTALGWSAVGALCATAYIHIRTKR